MAGGRGRRGQVSNVEAQHRDRSVQDVMIEDLQRQVTELTQRLVAQDFKDCEASDHDSNSTFENPYHNRALFREHRRREERHGDLDFQINEVERIFYYKEVPDCVKVKLIAIKLKGRASAWQGKAKITDWEKMKGHFLPFSYTQILFQRLHTLRQGARSVDDYTKEFYQLVAQNDLSKMKEQMVARYLERLHQPLQDVLSLHSLWNISETYQRALVVEKQQNRRPGHRVTDCRKPANQKGKNLLIEENVVDETKEIGEPVYDDDETDDVLYGDGHETLVVHKSLLTPKGDSGDDCNSCENVVSEEVVQKLQLKTDHHPKPYKLKYFNNAWCDVVSMDACHVLLRVMDAWTAMSFMMDGRIRIPLTSREKVCVGALAGRTHSYPDEIEHGDMVYALLPCENSAVDVDTDLPTEVQQRLAELSNLMPKDLPPGLPPMRDI
ncbi:hypothetical protein I3760_12G009300 [Carya illinoinensis]|nr:hypothetical protein I3760_12G009300 [Carya illinoinensis]